MNKDCLPYLKILPELLLKKMLSAPTEQKISYGSGAALKLAVFGGSSLATLPMNTFFFLFYQNLPTFKKLRSRPHNKKSALSSRHNC